ncbi:MAG: DUF4118 domain-containing protein, partial [Deltaproteobacteria bacterium]
MPAETFGHRSRQYGVAAASFAIALALRFAVDPLLGDGQPFVTFLVGVAVTAWIAGSQSATAVLVLGLVAGEYLFVPVRHVVSITNPKVAGIVEGALYLLVAGIIVAAAAALRGAERYARRSRARERAETRESRVRLRDFAAYLQVAREEERAHISRELHDDLGQVLTALKLQSASLSKRLHDDTNASTALLQPAATMVELCDQAIAVVRGIVQALLPPLLDEQGLLDAIRQNAGTFETQANIRCEVTATTDIPTIDPNVSLAAFRIVQEALTNAARHA